MGEFRKFLHMREVNDISCLLHNNFIALLRKSVNIRDKHHKIVKQLKSNPDMIIIQTDKSNKLAIINAKDYMRKMETCIQDMKYVCS